MKTLRREFRRNEILVVDGGDRSDTGLDVIDGQQHSSHGANIQSRPGRDGKVRTSDFYIITNDVYTAAVAPNPFYGPTTGF